MAGILANTASVTMTVGDTSPVNTFAGYITDEQATISVTPAGTSFRWSISKPSGSSGRAVLSGTTAASVLFTPDVGGFYVITCTVDSTTEYRLTLGVTQVAISTTVEASRYQPKTNASVVAPPLGQALFYSSDLSSLAVKNPDGSVDAIGAATASLLAVANTTALGTVDDASLNDGSVVSMLSVKNLWFLDKTSALSIDGITVIATNSGTGRWVRMIQSNTAWRYQTGWHINQATGNDENDGSTAGTALASHEEFQRRVADEDQPLSVNMVVTFDANYVGDIENTVSVMQVAPYGSITYQGSRTVVYSGSVTGTNPWVTGTTAGDLTDSAVPVSFAASGALNQLCILTSGANSGTAAWLTLESAPKTVRHSGFWNETFFSINEPSIGDTYDVVELTTITGKITQVGDGYSVFRNLSFLSPGGFDIQVQIFGGYVGFTFCSIDCNSMNYAGGGTFGHGFFCCRIDCTSASLRFFNADCSFYANWFLTGLPLAASGGRVNVPARNMVQQKTGAAAVGAPLRASSGGFVEVVLAGQWVLLGAASAGNRAILCENYGSIRVTSSAVLWGAGNSYDYAVEVKAGGKLNFAQPVATRFQLPGATVNDVLIGGTASAFAGLPVADLGQAAFVGEL